MSRNLTRAPSARSFNLNKFRALPGRPLLIRRAFLLAYLGINSMWKSISEKRQCLAKNRLNGQHNKHKSIRCATKRTKARPAALTTRLCLMHAKAEAYDT